MTRKKPLVAVSTALTVTLGVGLGAAGCLDRPIDRLEPRTTSTVVERLTQTGVDKIDMLLAIDNSISMADKQAILAAAVPDLVDRLVQPICVDEEGTPVGGVVDAAGECATGKPEFPPVTDIHVGIISSSLGALTAKQCDGVAGANPTTNDHGQLLDRAGGGGTVTTWNNAGFLAWDPNTPPKDNPPGETDPAAFKNNLGDLVVGIGQEGCGYEMQLESIVHFLVDPNPYESLTDAGGGYITRMGTDQTIIQQRKDFMRSNSLLAIIILSDENDCSIDIGGQGKLVLEPQPFYKANSKCAADPNDKCCTSCALDPVKDSSCSADPACAGGGASAPRYSATEDSVNLRCFNQKQRYGVDFLYPIQRYVNAFTQPQINAETSDMTKGKGTLVDNPIFMDLSGEGQPVRDAGLVFIAGIVGVPWQALSRTDTNGNPDLKLGFKPYNELAQEGAFDKLIGDPDKHINPTDPFMQESINKRSGTSDLTGESLPGNNTVNGNDRNIPQVDDLQYACIFPLATPNPTGKDCDLCTDASCDNPLCNTTTQVNAKAYPGLRELSLLRGMGDQGIFASICPSETNDTSAADFGYRPAVGAIIDRLKTELGGQCLPRQLKPNSEGDVPCLVLEASVTDSCDCSGARQPIPTDDPKYNAVKAAQQDPFANADWNCFCEITQLTGDEQKTCQTQDPAPNGLDGWCYVDSGALIANCPANEKQLVHFVGAGEPQSGSTVFITCTGE